MLGQVSCPNEMEVLKQDLAAMVGPSADKINQIPAPLSYLRAFKSESQPSIPDNK